MSVEKNSIVPNEQEVNGPCSMHDDSSRYCNRNIAQMSHTSYMDRCINKRMESLPKYIYLQDQLHHMVPVSRSSKFHSVVLYNHFWMINEWPLTIQDQMYFICISLIDQVAVMKYAYTSGYSSNSSSIYFFKLYNGTIYYNLNMRVYNLKGKPS